MSKKNSEKEYTKALRTLSRNLRNLESFPQSSEGSELEGAFTKTVCWCSGLSLIYRDNPARIYLGSAWSEVINILALVPLCFYRQGLICMRIILDSILAFSFFESHPTEFKTAQADANFWIAKDAIYEFHKNHSWRRSIDFKTLGIWTNLNNLYVNLSRIIHAQQFQHMSLVESFEGFTPNAEKISTVIEMAKRTDETISVFLASLYQTAFDEFGPELKRAIIKGLDRNMVSSLHLRP